MFDFSAMQKAINDAFANVRKITAELPTEPGIYINGKKVDSLPTGSIGSSTVIVNGKVSNVTYYVSDQMAAMPGQSVSGQIAQRSGGQALESVITRA